MTWRVNVHFYFSLQLPVKAALASHLYNVSIKDEGMEVLFVLVCLFFN